jgi:hypothetical protein
LGRLANQLQAAIFFPSAANRRLDSLRGMVMYSFQAGRRFLKRGSARPGRLATRCADTALSMAL